MALGLTPRDQKKTWSARAHREGQMYNWQSAPPPIKYREGNGVLTKAVCADTSIYMYIHVHSLQSLQYSV